MSIKVVKVNRSTTRFTIYIGRAWAEYRTSRFHNPFHIGADGEREEVIAKFAVYWYASEQRGLREHALERIGSDAILGCWCHPQQCHGDIIAGYITWKRQEATLWE